MKYLKEFNTHASYEDKINIGGSDLEIPIVSYCDDVSDVHYNPYNTVEFYVGNITRTTPQTVSIYTYESTSVDIQVSEGNKWYTYLLPKDKGLYKIEGDSVKKVVVKADITTSGDTIIPYSTVEASFKGSNTSNVTNMYQMFNMRKGLTSLDVSSFDTSNVTNMYSMFSDCGGLTSLDLSNFKTSKVTNMGHMFSGCKGLTSLDVSNFDTSNVPDMSNMFSGCKGLTSLDVSNFDTSKVTNMAYMFYNCEHLMTLILNGWNMANIADMSWMFRGCTNLDTIRMIGCNQTTITKIQTQLGYDNITGVEIVTK